MELEIIIIKFSCIIKRISRNTFPEPQPDSASYSVYLFVLALYLYSAVLSCNDFFLSASCTMGFAPCTQFVLYQAR